MPRIKDHLLDCVVYLYPSSAQARAGEETGGTGFLIIILSEKHQGFAYLYAVTNSHVIREGNSPVLRLNTLQGSTDVLEYHPSDWVHHSDGDDVAAIHIGGIDRQRFKFRGLPVDMLITQEAIKNFEIGPGDEVFMLGRFVAHDGKQRNLPSVRFGNISMMPWEPVLHPRGIKQESFVVETRSLPGYSGSPVFVYTPFDEHHYPWSKRQLTQIMPGGPWLLGVDWGHQPVYDFVLERDKQTRVQEKYVVRSNSGMMNVVPAWKLRDLLNEKPFAEMRTETDEAIGRRKAQSTAVLDVEIIKPD